MSVPPVSGPLAPHAERPLSPVDASAELRQRRAEQARESQAPDREPAPEEPGRSPVAEPARKEAIAPYRVTLDPETSRLTTEVLDTETGRVLLRIPPLSVFTVPESDGTAPADGARTDGAKPDGERRSVPPFAGDVLL